MERAHDVVVAPVDDGGVVALLTAHPRVDASDQPLAANGLGDQDAIPPICRNGTGETPMSSNGSRLRNTNPRPCGPSRVALSGLVPPSNPRCEQIRPRGVEE